MVVCPTYIVLWGWFFFVFCFVCLFFICLRLVCHMLTVSLDCPFLITPSIFPSVYLYCYSKMLNLHTKMQNYDLY